VFPTLIYEDQMKPETPKFTIVYQDDPNGYCYSLRNSKNEYASVMNPTGPSKRSWRTAIDAELYITKWADSTSLIWSAYTEKALPSRHVVTAATYKPPHGGYPEPKGTARPQFLGQELDRMSAPTPLVWPVIPPHDDGSNEEASTVPDVIIVAAIMANSRTLLGVLLGATPYYPNL
jgi:hypothetical protein